VAFSVDWGDSEKRFPECQFTGRFHPRNVMPALRSLPSLSSFTDEQLVALFQAGQAEAIDELVTRYRRVARAKARHYFVLGADIDDIEQEGLIGLYKAARDFRPDRGSFRSFADVCITRQLLTAIKAATRRKHQPLNRYVSLSGGSVADHDEPDVEVHLDDPSAVDPAEAAISAESVAALQVAIDELLSGLEVAVLGRFVEGRSYEEIGADLGRQPKAVDNALQRIKRKLGGHLDSQEEAAVAA
jgi:RNA polymerase sporulation-specific sigma factor